MHFIFMDLVPLIFIYIEKDMLWTKQTKLSPKINAMRETYVTVIII